MFGGDDSQNDERYCFITEWYDPNAALIRKYQFFFYPKDLTVEMYDIKNHRVFLRRCKCETLRLEDLFIGSTKNILSRHLKFVDFGDDFTRMRMSSAQQRTLALIKPDAVAKVGQIIDIISKSGLQVSRLKMCQLSRNEAFELYQEHQSKPFFNPLVTFVTSGPVIAMELMGENCIGQWRQVLGPTDSSLARSEAPMSIRARFGTDNTRNACHGSDSPESAARELEFFFPSGGAVGRQSTATFSDCTLCVIKPHAVLSGMAGSIIQKIMEAGFQISAVSMHNMEKANAEEFFEVYKGVVQEYPSMVTELTSGPCIAMEIRAQDAAKAFRDMVGPADPEIARHLRPRTLRAQFGKNKIQNAVHCTDLPEDALLEVEYFFKILEA